MLPDLLNAELKAEYHRNTHGITSIMKTVNFCAEQNIALTGRDGGSGNFMELLRFRIDAGDDELKCFMGSAARNAKYSSPTVQNEMLEVLGRTVQEKVVSAIQCEVQFSHCSE